MSGSAALAPPQGSDTWIALSGDPLPVSAAQVWVVRPSCGATVCFTGTARDHSEGRPGVELLEYEAYEEQALVRLGAVADAIRAAHPGVARIALLHRVGALEVGDTAVVVAVSAPHRDEAFVAARLGIEELKSTVPIWKRERWATGASWGADAQPLPGGEAADAAAHPGLGRARR